MSHAVSGSTSMQLIELAEQFADIARALAVDDDTDPARAWAAITATAVRIVPGAEHASISRGQQGRFTTLAPTGDLAVTVDAIQYELGSGPCVDAIVEDRIYRSGDIAADGRWPAFGPRAHDATGTRSMLSYRMFFEDGRGLIAGLNLYSTNVDAFDDDARAVGMLLAVHGAQVMSAALSRHKVVNLQRALTSNRHIGVAMGILMAAHKVTEDDAFALLRIASQHTNRRLGAIADDVILTGVLDVPPPQRQPKRGQRT